MTDHSSDLKRAAEHWNRQAGASDKIIRWWACPAVLRHQNRIVCGEEIDGFAAGVRSRLRNLLAGKTLGRAVSVGCGNGAKEMTFIDEGTVSSFDLFEISETRIEQGQSLAKKRGLSDKVTFWAEDAFEVTDRGIYDLVYWDNALHHMFDVREALQWSRRVLRQGGYIVINDFIGPDRFQWSDETLELMSRVREILPNKFLECGRTGRILPKKIERPTIDGMLAMDPSEAADSSRIVSEARAIFPNGAWIYLGGMIYHTALNDLIWTFDEYDAEHILKFCLHCDELMANAGHNQYGVYISRV